MGLILPNVNICNKTIVIKICNIYTRIKKEDQWKRVESFILFRLLMTQDDRGMKNEQRKDEMGSDQCCWKTCYSCGEN